MRTSLYFIMCIKITFSFVIKRWNIPIEYSIDTITKHDKNLFIASNNKLSWFTPSSEKIYLENRWLPRQIRHMVINPSSLLISLTPSDSSYISETIIFHKGKQDVHKWTDNTLYENLVENRLIRINHYGNIQLHDKSFNLSCSKYTSMTLLENKYLCCILNEKNKQTRVDLYDMTSNDPTKIIYTYRMMTPMCSYPCHVEIFLQECYPKTLIYFVISYRIGGTYVGNTNFPPDNNENATVSVTHLPDSNTILSLTVDYPYLYTLNTKLISIYKFPSIIAKPMYMGEYKPYKSMYQHTNKLIAIKNQVFWNGEDILHSLEIND